MTSNHLICCSDRSNTFATLGALHWHDVRGKLANVTHYSCCGSGSVLATMLAAGTSPKNIAPALIDSDIFSAVTPRDSTFREMTKFLMGRFGHIPTLSAFHKLTGKSVDYHVYNVTLQRLEVFSHLTTPLMSVIAACCFCYNIPYTEYVQSYCGSEYIDSSFICPIPSTTPGMCICAVPDIRAVSTFKVYRMQIVPGRLFNREETVECIERTAQVRTLCTAYCFAVQQAATTCTLLLLVPFPYTSANKNEKYEMLARWKDYAPAEFIECGKKYD